MNRNIDLLTNTNFDLLIIGGGIYGACIAWDAALRGYSVALIEKEDFGHATSANSLKIIHGGLRYLQNLDIKRMRESIHERTVLMQIAPHLVHPMPCLVPTYGHFTMGRELMKAALKINDLIGFDRNNNLEPDKHIPEGKLISRQECINIFPGLPTDGLSGGAIWYDCQMYNSERLTLSFIISAANKGAVAANYVEAINLLQDNTRISGVTAIDKLSGDKFDIRAKLTINSAGPWVDRVLSLLIGSKLSTGINFAKALIVAVPQLIKDYNVGLYNHREFDGDVSRRGGPLMFIVPWHNQSLIGTTYTLYNEHPDQFEISESDIRELIEEINHSYPPLRLKLDDVVYVYGGLVPIVGVNHKIRKIQRERQYKIYDHKNEGIDGLISIMGVKYTTARDVAEKVVDYCFTRDGRTPPKSLSAKTPLHGGSMARINELIMTEVDKNKTDISAEKLRELIYNYGSEYKDLLGNYKNDDKNMTVDEALLRAQIIYSVHHEMAQKLSDIIFRRTEVGVGGIPNNQVLEFASRILGQELGWDEARIQNEVEEVKNQYQFKLSH
jgi:glycerol-3-phosphate dehydrogenase